MKVSIITSCYNREATIRGAIESVLEQDYPDIEYMWWTERRKITRWLSSMNIKMG